MGQRLGVADWDHTRIRVHTDGVAARSAEGLGAAAYSIGNHIVFGAGRYAPGTTEGDRLLRHELAHVRQHGSAGRSDGDMAQHTGTARVGTPSDPAEHEAESMAHTGSPARRTRPAADRTGPQNVPIIRRRVELRDVGRGEQSGVARLPDLVARLTAMSSGLDYALDGRALTYTAREGGTPSEFDRLMMDAIDSATTVPLRLTNRHGLLGTPAAGFHDQVIFDAFGSGYLDVEDLLASTDLGIQAALAHVITERIRTRNYARRIGTPGLNAAFPAGHAAGITAEERVLRDFFGDPTIRVGPEPVHAAIGPGSRITVRLYRNSRHDIIRWRIDRGAGAAAGLDPSSVQVTTHDGRVMTADEYRESLQTEQTRRQVEGERLRGATEHREGARSVPAP